MRKVIVFVAGTASLVLGAFESASGATSTSNLVQTSDFSDRTKFTVARATLDELSTANNGTFRFTSQQLWGMCGQTMSSTAPLNLSAKSGLAFTIRNPGSQPVTGVIRLDLDRNALNNQGATSTCTFRLLPNETKTYTYLFQGLNKGMAATPAYVADESEKLLDNSLTSTKLKTVTRWSILSAQAGTSTFEVSNIRVITGLPNVSRIVDAFGQPTDFNFTNKLTSDSALSSQGSAEAVDLLANAQTAQFAGEPGTPKFSATGAWRTAQDSEGRKCFVTPAGRRFWMFGVNTVVDDSAYTQTAGRESMFTWLPTATETLGAFYRPMRGSGPMGYSFYRANLYRKSGPTWRNDWTETTRKRLEAWGTNTVGAWSLPAVYKNDIPYTKFIDTTGATTLLPSPAGGGNRIPDPYSTLLPSYLRTRFAANLASDLGKPNLTGVFVDNELMWGRPDVTNGDQALVIAIFSAPTSQPARQEFIRILTAKYGTISKLNTAWGTRFTTWMAISGAANLANINATGKNDVRALLGALATRYYKTVKEALTAVAPGTIYLGSRMGLWCTPDAALRAAGPFVDVYSMNIYAFAKDVPWTYLAGLSKPVLISEFGFNGGDAANYMYGDRNPYPITANQTKRAEAYAEFLEQARSNTNILGAMMFQYVDQPLTGREWDTENHNFGLVNVTDSPYQLLIQTIRNFARSQYAVRP